MSEPKLGLVPGALRAPPYSPDTRLYGWRFQIDVPRIRQSDTWALCAAEFRPWLLWLWIKSWEEIPTGSYPNEDAIIAAKIGMTFELFDGHRAMLMRGWYRASDNRLYHPYITELVRGRLAWKDAERSRKAAWREAHKSDVPPDGQSVPRDIQGTVTRDGDDAGVGVGVGVGVDVELPETSTPRGKGKGAGKGNPKTERASRLPEDWKIPDEWIEWTLAFRPDWTRAGVIAVNHQYGLRAAERV